jgi:hypothetical protein
MPKLSFLSLLSSLFFWSALFLLVTSQTSFCAQEHASNQPEIRLSVSEFAAQETKEYGIVYRTKSCKLEFRPTQQAGYYQLFTPARYPRNQDAPELEPTRGYWQKDTHFFLRKSKHTLIAD